MIDRFESEHSEGSPKFKYDYRFLFKFIKKPLDEIYTQEERDKKTNYEEI